MFDLISYDYKSYCHHLRAILWSCFLTLKNTRNLRCDVTLPFKLRLIWTLSEIVYVEYMKYIAGTSYQAEKNHNFHQTGSRQRCGLKPMPRTSDDELSQIIRSSFLPNALNADCSPSSCSLVPFFLPLRHVAETQQMLTSDFIYIYVGLKDYHCGMMGGKDHGYIWQVHACTCDIYHQLAWKVVRWALCNAMTSLS